MDPLTLDGQPLTLAEIEAVSLAARPVAVAPAALARVAQCQTLIEEILAAGETVYGVNTGFGKLSDVRIPPGSLAQLQKNLVRSHAGGVGQPLSEAEARAMLLLRANVLAKGFSGCRSALVELLVALLNAGVHPVIPEKGSVGASGDLAPWLIWRWWRSAKARRITRASGCPAARRCGGPGCSPSFWLPRRASRC